MDAGVEKRRKKKKEKKKKKKKMKKRKRTETLSEHDTKEQIEMKGDDTNVDKKSAEKANLNATKDSNWTKPAGWEKMSKSKKRRIRKMRISGKIEREAYNNVSAAETAASKSTESESSRVDNSKKIDEYVSVQPKGLEHMSKSKKRRIRRMALSKQPGKNETVVGMTALMTKAPPLVEPEGNIDRKKRSEDVAVKDHPMYRKYWRLSLHPGVIAEDVKAKMAADNLDTSLFGQWGKKIARKGHGSKTGSSGKSKAMRRRERKKRQLVRDRLSASIEERSCWDQVGVTQAHSFVKKAEDPGSETGPRNATRKKDKKKRPQKSKTLIRINKGKTVYVSGLPHHVGVKKVRQYFKSCGAVAFVSMPRFDDTGKSRGIAHVTFTRKASARRAVDLSGEYWGQRYLEITPYDDEQWKPATAKPADAKTVFVGNLAYDMEEATLREIFSPCGTIESIRWGTDKESGEFRCFGHVTFAESTAVDKAVALAGSICLGRPLRVDYAEDKKNADAAW
eukprot:g282.t1